MGTISARSGVALTVAALASSGFTLLAGPAQAAALTSCAYTVTARSGLNVRKGPGTNFGIITALPFHTHISATCTTTNNFVKIIRPITFNGKHIRGGWVSRTFLARPTLTATKAPHGGVSTGGGSTSDDTSPLLPLAGLGLITLGSGVALASWRRRAMGAVPTA